MSYDNYDDWKLATPPEVETEEELPKCKLCFQEVGEDDINWKAGVCFECEHEAYNYFLNS